MKTPLIQSLDHLVLTVASIDATIAFYRDVLGMEEITFGDGRKALTFGTQKINLHQAGAEFEPKARVACAGSADLCFLATVALEEVAARLAGAGIAIELGPVPKVGATGPITSLYLRDPDGNLIEISVPA